MDSKAGWEDGSRRGKLQPGLPITLAGRESLWLGGTKAVETPTLQGHRSLSGLQRLARSMAGQTFSWLPTPSHPLTPSK